jgi:hypothetical protein
MKKILNEWRKYILEAIEEDEILLPLEMAIKDPKLRDQWNKELISSGEDDYGVSPLGWNYLERLYKKGGMRAVEEGGEAYDIGGAGPREAATGLLLDPTKRGAERWGSPQWEFNRKHRGRAAWPKELMPQEVRRQERKREREIKIQEPLEIRGAAPELPTPAQSKEQKYKKKFLPPGYEEGARISVPKEGEPPVTIISPYSEE